MLGYVFWDVFGVLDELEEEICQFEGLAETCRALKRVGHRAVSIERS